MVVKLNYYLSPPPLALLFLSVCQLQPAHYLRFLPVLEVEARNNSTAAQPPSSRPRWRGRRWRGREPELPCQGNRSYPRDPPELRPYRILDGSSSSCNLSSKLKNIFVTDDFGLETTMKAKQSVKYLLLSLGNKWNQHDWGCDRSIFEAARPSLHCRIIPRSFHIKFYGALKVSAFERNSFVYKTSTWWHKVLSLGLRGRRENEKLSHDKWFFRDSCKKNLAVLHLFFALITLTILSEHQTNDPEQNVWFSPENWQIFEIFQFFWQLWKSATLHCVDLVTHVF